MFIINLHYKKPLTEVEQYLAAHRQHLEDHYQQGILLASGPKNPRDGGIIIACGNNIQTVEAMMNKDPFTIAGIIDYHIIEFTPVKYHQSISQLIED